MSLTLSPSNPWFLRFCSSSLLKNTMVKGESARDEQFLLFSVCFHIFKELSSVAIKFEIVVCKLLQFGRVHNLSFGKGLMLLHCQNTVYTSYGKVRVDTGKTMFEVLKFKVCEEDEQNVNQLDFPATG